MMATFSNLHFKASLLSLTVITLICTSSAQVTDDDLKYSDLDSWGVKGQWDIVVYTGRTTGDDASANLTGLKNYTGCTNEVIEKTDVCNSPPLTTDETDTVIRVEAALKDPSAGLLCRVPGPAFPGNRTSNINAPPTHYKAQLCYSDFSTTNRGWRSKKDAYPQLSLRCPFTVGEVKVNAEDGNATAARTELSFSKFFSDFDEVPSATFYVKVQAYAEPENKDEAYVCAYQTTSSADIEGEEATENRAAYVMTDAALGRTPDVTAAAIVFSVFSVAFLVVYSVADTLYYKKTGRGLNF